jgi:hypothetical protein
MPGCANAGEFRAPKSRETLNDYWWFCLEHVRAYNAGWDFYKGMSAGQIETQLRQDTGWQRPTWPLGSLGGGALDADKLHDSLDLLGASRWSRSGWTGRPPSIPSRAATRRWPNCTTRTPMAGIGRRRNG